MFLSSKKYRKFVKKSSFKGHKKPFRSNDKTIILYGFNIVSNKTNKSGEKYGFNQKWAIKEATQRRNIKKFNSGKAVRGGQPKTAVR